MSDENMNLGTPEAVNQEPIVPEAGTVSPQPGPVVNETENVSSQPGPAFQAYQQVPPVPPVPPIPPTGGHPQYHNPEPIEQGKGFSIASMVLGIVSLCLCCIWYLSIPCALVGLVLGIASMVRKYAGRGMAIAGVICSGVGIILCVIMLLVVAVVGVASYSNFKFYY